MKARTAPTPTVLLPIPEVARRLGISRPSVYDHIARGNLGDIVPVGTGMRPRVRVTEAAVEAFLAKRAASARAA